MSAVRREHGQPRGRLVLLAHRDPGVGDDHVGAGHGRDRVRQPGDRAAGRGGDRRGRARTSPSRGQVAVRRRPSRTCMPGGRAGEQPGVAHVAGARRRRRPRSARPASPLCSRTVSRSASSWQGWNSSVSALTTGTPAYSAISSRSDWAKVRHTIVDDLAAEHPGDVLDRLAHPDAGELAVDEHRVAAELGDRRRRRTPGCAASACRRSSRPTAGPRRDARRTAPP